jgi:hypothetical protein
MSDAVSKGGGGANGGDGGAGIVSGEYWFDVAAELIKGRVSRIDTAAEKFVTGIAWFWSAYTASALVGIELANRALERWQLGVVGLPVLLLIAAYLAALYTLAPGTTREFDPRVPYLIKEAQDQSVSAKQSRLRITIFLTTLGAVAVAIAIGVVLSAPEAGPTTFSAEFQEADSSIEFSGRVSDGKSIPVTLCLIPATETECVGDARTLQVTTSESGAFNGAFEDVEPAEFRLEASWKSGDNTIAVSAALEPPEEEQATTGSPTA